MSGLQWKVRNLKRITIFVFARPDMWMLHGCQPGRRSSGLCGFSLVVSRRGPHHQDLLSIRATQLLVNYYRPVIHDLVARLKLSSAEINNQNFGVRYMKSFDQQSYNTDIYIHNAAYIRRSMLAKKQVDTRNEWLMMPNECPDDVVQHSSCDKTTDKELVITRNYLCAI